MAVYTKVNAPDVAEFLKSYDLGNYERHEGITQGIENTNYQLFTTSGCYILTIFEQRTNESDLPFIFDFIDTLAKAGLSVPGTYKNTSGAYVGRLAGKPAAIIQYLEGQGMPDADITPDHCAGVGRTLAAMHNAAQNYPATRANPVGIAQWRKLLSAAIPKTNVIDAATQNKIDETLTAYESLNAASLPRGPVHADAFPDNVFFKDGKLTGVIDFYFTCTDSFVYDVAMTVNAWCFKTDGQLVPERLKAFAASYESVRHLTAPERAAFKTLRAAAALRILATRLYDWAFTPAGADVVKKDPVEYALKLKADIAWP